MPSPRTQSVAPIASRAILPADYGLPEDSPLLPWDAVAERVAKARHYWIATASARAVPIARPIDGMWVAGALYFGGHEGSRWRRNVQANPNVCVTLEDAESPVMIEGTVTVETPDAALAAALNADAVAKYEWATPGVAQYEVPTCVLRPRTVLAWTLLYRDATRFDFSYAL